VRIAIGDFARMTHLSIKALRHYHDLGVLVPAEVDPSSGYRFYRADQVPVAQVIRRFRDLGMPLEDIRAVLRATDPAARTEVIVRHLDRMQLQLSQIQGTVASLRALLDGSPPPIPVEHRTVPAVAALAIADRVTMANLELWWADAFDELHAAVRAAGVMAGVGGGLYPGELFEVEVADVVAFLPVATPVPTSSRARMVEIPAAELAVAVHHGPFAELDRTYGAVGIHVAERELGIDGPIREYYLVTAADTPDESQHRIEVCWPIFQTVAS
jgi:DNA-binding transcriptional MerR regulator/effector-binding domain-containing protein